jgi:ketosteroid isomerase-like protein
MSSGELIKGLYDSFAVGDMPAVLGAFSPDIHWTEAEGFMYGGEYSGPEAILQNVFMKFATEWEGFKVTPHKFIDGGSDVVALGSYSGKYLRTGRSVDVPFAHVWTVGGDGKVTSMIQFTDTAVIERSLGL